MATVFKFAPEAAQFPSTNYPELKVIHTTERRFVLSFDAATEEACAWHDVAPQGLTLPLTATVFYSMASATSGGVAAGISIEALTPGDAVDVDGATSYDTENVGTDATVPGTAGYIDVVPVTLTTADSMAAGDLVRFKLARKVANGADTATGDMQVHLVEVQDAS